MQAIELDDKVSLNSMVTASADLISSDLAGEVIMLDLKSGIYYGLDSVGARIWSLLQEPKSIIQIRDVILAEYDVDQDRCEQDLRVLIDEMLSRGLIELKNNGSEA